MSRTPSKPQCICTRSRYSVLLSNHHDIPCMPTRTCRRAPAELAAATRRFLTVPCLCTFRGSDIANTRQRRHSQCPASSRQCNYYYAAEKPRCREVEVPRCRGAETYRVFSPLMFQKQTLCSGTSTSHKTTLLHHGAKPHKRCASYVLRRQLQRPADEFQVVQSAVRLNTHHSSSAGVLAWSPCPPSRCHCLQVPDLSCTPTGGVGGAWWRKAPLLPPVWLP